MNIPEKIKAAPTRMYICVKEGTPNQFIPVICAHASLACYLKFEVQDDMVTWLRESFRKVVCVVSEKEFDRLKEVPNTLVMTESALEGKEVAIVCCPREEYPKMFKFFKLYK